MEIKLKNIQYAAFASEETDCFHASVWIDGKKAGTVSNDGRGGANLYSPYALYMRLRDHCQSIPPDMEGRKVTPDEIIGNLLDAWMNKREKAKVCKGKTLFRAPGKPYEPNQWSVMNQPFDATVKLFLIGRYGSQVEIFNEQI